MTSNSSASSSLIECTVCHRHFEPIGTNHVYMTCSHHIHLHCAAELILAGRFRCIVCRPGTPLPLARVVDTGCDAAHSERVADALRAARAEEVRIELRRRPSHLVDRGDSLLMSVRCQSNDRHARARARSEV